MSIELHLGDCLEILPTLGAGSVDAVITDPPYGVNFTGKAGHYRNEPSAKRDDTYTVYEDTKENWYDLILPRIERAIEAAPAAAFFMESRRVLEMPKGGHLGGLFMPNGCGSTSWGFKCFMHVVFYGKDPYLANRMGRRPDGKYGVYGNDSNKIDHPCAKPLAATTWLVERASLPGMTVLDPFMGSGTTGVACVKTGRNFIGIEIDPDYYEIAKKRIAEAQLQPTLEGLT